MTGTKVWWLLSCHPYGETTPKGSMTLRVHGLRERSGSVTTLQLRLKHNLHLLIRFSSTAVNLGCLETN